MTVDEALLSRRSVRAFLPDPVPRATVEDILRLASHAPSGQNTQPWKVYAVEGAVRERLCDAVLARRECRPWPEREYPGQARDLPDIFRRRRRENGIGLYTLLGIGKGDREAAEAQQRRNYLFFGAPVGLFIFVHKALSIGSWVDTGMFLQAIMMAARARGLDTCPQGAWANFHTAVRAHVGAGEDETLVCGMALGHADGTALVNRFETPRAPLEEFVTFVGEKETPCA